MSCSNWLKINLNKTDNLPVPFRLNRFCYGYSIQMLQTANNFSRRSRNEKSIRVNWIEEPWPKMLVIPLAQSHTVTILNPSSYIGVKTGNEPCLKQFTNQWIGKIDDKSRVEKQTNQYYPLISVVCVCVRRGGITTSSNQHHLLDKRS